MNTKEKDVASVTITKDDIIAYYKSIREDIAQATTRKTIRIIKAMIDEKVEKDDYEGISGDEVYETAEYAMREIFSSKFKDYFKEITSQNKAEYIYIDDSLLQEDDFIEYAYSETLEWDDDIHEKVAIRSICDSTKVLMDDQKMHHYLLEVEDKIREEIDNEFADIQANIKEKNKTDLLKDLYDEYVNATIITISDIIHQKFEKIINEEFKPVLLDKNIYANDIDNLSIIPTSNAFLDIIGPEFHQYHMNIRRYVVKKLIHDIERGEDSGISPSL
ncbi:MAG: hypothetical protein QXV17_08715 [Candidatus Micrarchaeaceae archaeon]